MAVHSKCIARTAALAIAAITGEPGRGASLNSSACRHFECSATPRAERCTSHALCSAHPTPLALTCATNVRATGWPRGGQLGAFASQRRSVKNWMGRSVGHPGLFGSHAYHSRGGNWLVVGGQLGAFASRYGSVKNWMDRRVTHPGLLALARNARVGATGWSLVGQLGAFASRRGGVKNWMDRGSHASRPGGRERSCGKCALESAAGPAQRATVRFIARCSFVTQRSPLQIAAVRLAFRSVGDTVTHRALWDAQ